MDIFLMNIGHPRTGTGYMTTVYKALGLDIGHEKVGKDGISDWALSFDNFPSWDTRNLPIKEARTFEKFNPKYIIYNVRDPWTSISAIRHEIYSEYLRVKVIPNFMDYEGYERAIISLLGFDEQIRKNRKVDAVVRIEHPEDFLEIDFLSKLPLEQYPTKIYNARKHTQMTHEDWMKISPDLIERLDQYCTRYNYPKISDRILSEN